MSSSGKVGRRNILITGAGAGIGRQLALDFADRDPQQLLLLDRDAVALKRLEQHPAMMQRRVRAFHCDVSSGESIAEFFAQLGDVPVDLLINNAGIHYSGPFSSMRMEDFENVLAVNLVGAVRLTHALLPRMLGLSDAAIVNVSSLAGLVAGPGMCAYSTSKFGLVGFSEALRTELKGRVHVCTLCPGFVRTDIARNTVFGEGDAPDERSRRSERMEGVLRKFGASPAKISQILIRALEAKRELVLVNPEAYFFYYLKKLFPAVSDTLVDTIYRRMIKMGVIKA